MAESGHPAGGLACPVLRGAGKGSVYQWLIKKAPVIGRYPRSGFAPPQAIRAGAG
jgi:hypothetical protein